MPRRNFAEVLIGAVVLLVAAGFLVYAIAHSGRSATAGYQLYAKFDHVDGLSVGTDVRVAGVKVGSVDSTTLDPKTYQAVVGFRVADEVKLPKDSSAVITSESLLGGKYLALTPGGEDAMLQPGQTVTITQGSINIEELLGKFIFSASSLSSGKGGQGGGQGGGTPGGGPSGGGTPGGGSTGGGATGGGATDGGLPPLGGPGSGTTGGGTGPTGGAPAPLGGPAGGKSP
ncbi:MAG: outer membrane lipid asymmetry maintenance protein MlaD [Acetobacteraceae bacterium]|jgi:phospholipid/cholesterol/gamma-HCH transport system substrate-binding protein